MRHSKRFTASPSATCKIPPLQDYMFPCHQHDSEVGRSHQTREDYLVQGKASANLASNSKGRRDTPQRGTHKSMYINKVTPTPIATREQGNQSFTLMLSLSSVSANYTVLSSPLSRATSSVDCRPPRPHLLLSLRWRTQP